MPWSSIAVVGSRTIQDAQAVERVLDKILELNGPFVLVSGGADGADGIAETWARKKGLDTIVHPADWDQHGPKAGMVRNSQIINDADAVIAFWDGVSAGTLDSVRKAKTLKKRVVINLL